MSRVGAAFAAAAGWASEAGFSLLMVDAARGGLLAGFLSPVTNQRSDRYGGDVDARMRFPLEVFGRVKESWDGPIGGAAVGDRLDPRWDVARGLDRNRNWLRRGRCLAHRGGRRRAPWPKPTPATGAGI